MVGPSGCGKSTLLKNAAGAHPVQQGLDHRRPHEPRLRVPGPTLLPWRTVTGNVALLAELHDIPKARRDQLTADAIALVGLTGFEDKYPKALSGGMRMRCSLARSLVMKPKVFLFDEPFGAVDEITRERLNDELLSLFQREQFAGLFITHSIYEAVYLSTRVLVMSSRPGPDHRRLRRAVRIPAVARAPFPTGVRGPRRRGVARVAGSAQ